MGSEKTYRYDTLSASEDCIWNPRSDYGDCQASLEIRISPKKRKLLPGTVLTPPAPLKAEKNNIFLAIYRKINRLGLLWCPWPDSNGHFRRNSILSRARLPIPPQGHFVWRALARHRLRFKHCLHERCIQPFSAPTISLCRRECRASLPARTWALQIGSERPRQSVTKPPASRTNRQPVAVSQG